jgi:acetylornithine deacetylase/succinyl-diaminopimelate desuccinylase-like protein
VDDFTLSDYVKRSKERVLGSLLDWLKIPSISADPAHAADVARSAEFCAGLMRAAGLKHVETLSAGGVPAVYGDWLDAGHTVPTVLVYGHHDVQPVDPLDEWASPPFEPALEGNLLLARGASDDKGQVMMQLETTRGLLESLGHLPVNVKFLIEGEEEVGSPHLDELLEVEKERLAADVIVVSDSTMLAPDIPSTTVSTRGLIAFDVHIRTANSDLHSGIWGGTVPNAALVAARLAASLHDSDHRVTVPGFYDRVRELTPREARSLADTPFDELEFCRQAGVSELEGEAGRSAYERTGTRPTAEVVGLHSGYGGPGMKTIVPATANLKIAIRLVPEQSAPDIEASFRAWLAEHTPGYAEVTTTTIGGVAPLLTPVDHPAVHILSEAIENVWGKEPLFTRSGGSGPEEALCRILNAPVIFLGIGLPDDKYHAPNERLELNQLWQGIVAAGEFLLGLPALKRV